MCLYPLKSKHLMPTSVSSELNQLSLFSYFLCSVKSHFIIAFRFFPSWKILFVTTFSFILFSLFNVNMIYNSTVGQSFGSSLSFFFQPQDKCCLSLRRAAEQLRAYEQKILTFHTWLQRFTWGNYWGCVCQLREDQFFQSIPLLRG